jgi:Spy/CpxP family protein refolding chaperone
MKTFLKISVVTIGILSAAGAATFAAEMTTGSPAAAPVPGAVQRPGRGGPLRRMMIRRRLAEKLGLSADQITQIKATRKAAADNLKSIRNDATLAPDQKHARAHDIIANTRTQMRSVLTPEQQAKFDELRVNARKARGL